MAGRFVKVPTDLLEALCMIRVAGVARQVLDVIIRQTCGFHKEKAQIPYSKFIKLTGCKKQYIYRSLQQLKKMNIISVDKQGYFVINNDYSEWEPIKKLVINNDYNQSSIMITPVINNDYPLYYKRKLKDNIKEKNTRPVINNDYSPHVAIREYFMSEHERLFGFKYMFKAGKDGKHIKDLLKFYDQNVDSVKVLIDELFLQNTDYYKTKTIGKLLSDSNQLAQLAKERYHHKKDGIEEWLADVKQK